MAAILVWALLLNSSKWFEWRPVPSSEDCTPAVPLELGSGSLKNWTSHQEMIDRSTGLANVTGNWEDSSQNSTLKLTCANDDVASGNCEFQVLLFRYFMFSLQYLNNHIILIQEFDLQSTDLRNDKHYIIGFMNVRTIAH